jgi:hypothetical protein
MRRLLLIGTLLALVVATLGPGWPAAGATTQGAAAGQAAAPVSASDPAVRSLARQRGVPLAEAQRRIGWQVRSGLLGPELARTLGDRFGGIWIDWATDRVKVGVVGGGVDLSDLAARYGLADAVDVIAVRHDVGALQAALRTLSAPVVRANSRARWRVEAGLRPDLNKVELRLPPRDRLSRTQRTMVADAERRYGPLLEVTTGAGQDLQWLACSGPASGLRCDPPLRGGVRISGPRSECTAGFIAKSRVDSKKYVMTAGHCIDAIGETWGSYFSNGEGHPIGPAHNRVFNSGTGDAAIITINNPSASGWNPKHWVYLDLAVDDPDYYIINDLTPKRGDRVCLTGMTSTFLYDTTCGRVTRVDVPTSTGPLVEVDYLCVLDGDSGGPIFAGHVAYGLMSAKPANGPDCGTALFQDITRAETRMNVDVIHGG